MTLQEAYEYVTHDGLAKKLYDYMGHEYSKEAVLNDLKHDYLTINDGFDGISYIWYADSVNDAAIRVYDGEIIGDPDKIKELFYW